MISCQDAQSAGVNRQGFMQSELSRKIDDQPLVEIAAV